MSDAEFERLTPIRNRADENVISTYIVLSPKGYDEALADYLTHYTLSDDEFYEDESLKRIYPGVVTFDSRYNGGCEMTYVAIWESLQEVEARLDLQRNLILKHLRKE